MRKLLPALALILAACSSAGTSDDQSISDYCVEQVEALYRRHDLPFSSNPADRPRICAEWMAEHDLTTKADIATAVREIDRYYDDLDR